MDVIFKEGQLYLQGVKFGKRTWRKIWMVLLKPSPTGVGRLELSTVLDNSAATDQKKVYRQKTSERKVVRLSDFLSVIPAPEESSPPGCTAFYLHTTQCTYILASTTSEDWLSALCLLAFQKDPAESNKGSFERGNSLTMEDNDLYSSWKSDLTLPPNQYQVTIQSTKASKRCKLAGEYLVSPEEEAVILLDVNTGHVYYRWPYRLLRKFGQVEGGFSIEAGHRCESGEGLFIFLSTHGPQIFQAISRQCSLERRSSVQRHGFHRRSFSDMSPVILPVCSSADVSADTESDNHYATINDYPLLNVKCLSLVEPQLSIGDESEDNRCHSLDAVNLDIMEDSIYSNLKRATSPLIKYDEFKDVIDSECIYSDVSITDPQLQPLPQLPPSILPLSVPLTPPKPRYQRQPPVNNIQQPGYNTQAQPVDDMKEMEEAISSSTRVTPSEPPGSFKHRLAEIISKDLAKFQPPLPSGAGSPTFSQ